MATLESMAESFFGALRPPPKLSLSDWADEYAVLSAESSAEAGRWKTLPYQKGMMDAITDPLITQVTVIKSARVGFTKILNHVIAYHIHQDPCSMMLVQPTIEDAEGYSKEEISPMLRDTPVLAGLVSEAKAKDGSNTILQKLFPGGTLSLVGANSPRGFRRVSRRVVLFDEVDGYPPSAGTEGDQIKLGIRRSEYFWNRKIVAGSTPLVKEDSRIEGLFEQSDQRRYFVPCPSCGEFQYLQWKNLKWPDHEPDKAHFECEKNKCHIPHEKKRWMIERGEWRATAQGNGKHVGFHIWAAYSYSPNASWADLAEEFLDAKGNAEKLKTFVNTVLGESWEEAYSAKLGAEALRSRAESYEPNVVPVGALVLTAGVDVQDNRFSISIYGWGREEEAWLVSRVEIFGDPARPEIWKQLDSVLFSKYRHALGGELKISCSAIDSGGHFTHEVYQYARDRRRKRVIAVKGQSQRNKPAIGKPTKQDVNFRGQSLKWGVDLYPVGSDTIKSVLYGRLKHNEPGPGFMHFHLGLDEEFFKQLTSEKQKTRYVKGAPIREWVKKDGARNEALDEAVYAYAGLQWLYTRIHRKTFWQQFERALKIETPADPAPEDPPPEGGPPPPDGKQKETAESNLQKERQARNMRANRRKGGFVRSW
jgi:phage terminase large subunit GpA-like protein